MFFVRSVAAAMRGLGFRFVDAGRLLSYFVVFLCILSLLGCGSSVQRSVPGDLSDVEGIHGDDMRVGLLLPLSAPGQVGRTARMFKSAAELAMIESGDPGIALIVRDTGGTVSGTERALSAVLSQNVELILGPFFAKNVRAVGPIIRARGVPVLTFSTDRTIAGDGVYLLSFMSEQNVASIASYASGRGLRRFGILVPRGNYGDIVEQVFRSTIASGGGRVLAGERFTGDVVGSVERLTQLVKTPGRTIDALLIAARGNNLRTIGATLIDSDFPHRRVQILGTGLWDDRNITLVDIAQRGWYPSASLSGFSSFEARFSANFGYRPERLASLAYDGVFLAAGYARSAPAGERSGFAYLTRPSGFLSDVNGLFRFLPDGTTERRLNILEVDREDGGVRILQPAAQRF